MKTNTLVIHRKLNLGIGCVSKVMSKSVKVNFGLYDVKTCNPEALKLVDITHAKTITFSQYKNKVMMNPNDSTPDYVIVGNEVKTLCWYWMDYGGRCYL
jgi:hypothetical protein